MQMQQLRSLAEVAEASGGDPRCIWAAQGLGSGGAAWQSGGAVAVGCPALAGRDRLILRGPVGEVAGVIGEVAGLIRVAFDVLGPSFLAIGDPPLMAGLPGRVPWLEHAHYFGWMDGISRTRHAPAHRARWLARQEWRAADQVLSIAYPDSCARPGVRGVGRWAGITDDAGRLTSIAADAWSSPGIGFLSGAAVLPDARRAGQGRDVCAFVLDALLAAHGRVALAVTHWNQAAIGLYSQLGLTYRQQESLRVKAAATRGHGKITKDL
jgi:ribosomal protein S18 acetylase RimI-like enzyme